MAQCPRHPGSPATDMCVECGEMVCGQCAFVTADRRVFCPGCQGRAQGGAPAEVSLEALLGVPPAVEAEQERPLQTVPVARPRQQRPMKLEWSAPGPKTVASSANPPSKAIIWALVLPFVCCFYGSIIGLIIALRERKLVREGTSSTSPGLVTAAIWINGLELGITILLTVLSSVAK